ncbi:hypothetical protein BCR41DRAFT_333782 [Lobosporangium transversale]|uniref:Uncharacterized protein n=1 Tax=Lobosporangium transversale TaxID=64571 RepID=A0A1Y2GU55_9FUNG|nr:hypothetical protein BCR41DRAFT_333782 [Lobosporangium transversale]ORZ23787.1 hypothetical protein BCR41DRAFT_333782 [Lobosporangium transversale]|eukprot:XP_021883601.1 hypothetical protein BCR41DRAFT_333782 [Lobosporangium transversale]
MSLAGLIQGNIEVVLHASMLALLLMTGMTDMIEAIVMIDGWEVAQDMRIALLATIDPLPMTWVDVAMMIGPCTIVVMNVVHATMKDMIATKSVTLKQRWVLLVPHHDFRVFFSSYFLLPTLTE